MSCEPMPFVTGPVLESARPDDRYGVPQHISSVVPLSKTQQALWLDYLRRPYASHYHLTLEVDLSGLSQSLDHILQTIQLMGQQHAMLRTTFHVDSDNEIGNSFMAVHPSDRCVQNFEIVNDEAKLATSLRRGFALSSEFPVRWVIHHRIDFQNGSMKNSYKLFVVGHHIAVDGSSLSYLSKQLLEHLDPAAAPGDVGAGLSSGDYVQRQNALLKSASGEAAKQFWLSQVANTAPFSWTVPKPTTTTSDYRQMHTWAFFPQEELQSWSQLYKTSWFRIATTIVGLVTMGSAKPTPHHDHALLVAFGARPKEFQTCVAHMANTMPIKAPLSHLLQGDATFGEAVQALGKNLSNAKKHELFPFLSLIEAARKTMDERQLDLKVAVTFSPKLASKACRIYPVEGVWDLFFCFLEHDDGVSLGVIANPQIFGPAAMAKLQTQFLDTVKLSQGNHSFRLRELGYLQDRDVASIVNGPAIDDVEAISQSRVHLWIKSRAARQPDAVALSSAESGETMTYRALASKSSQIAHLLRAQGVQAGDSILLHLSRGFNTVLWILGALEAGACYVVLDKTLPTKRKQAISKVSEAKFAITDDLSIHEAVQGLEVTVLDLALLTVELRQQPSTTLPNTAGDNDLAYIVFTSGSTGQPKGVMVEHSNLSHYVSAARSVVKIGPGSRVLQFATFAFDASVLEWAVSLSYGATLCFVDHPQLLVGEYLATVIDKNAINFFHTTPSVLATIPTERRLSSLRMISVGGEASSAGLLARWRQRVPLLHAYGPTETTVIVTVETIREDSSPGAPLPSPSLIGAPFPNSKILICGEGDSSILGPGEPGEICIAGPQVSRGYKGNGELTRAKFQTINNTRLYRTGDRGFLDHDGKLSIGGRMKNREIKLRGYRIDLYEIEKSILDHNAEVQVASVQVQGDSLVAFVVPESAPCEAIRERLAQDVPSYSVPARFLAVPSLPLNANGKVDHAKVAEQMVGLAAAPQQLPGSKRRDSKMEETSGEEVSQRYGDSVREALGELWMQTLGLTAPPKADVTFYAAGGHSILLTELHKRIVSRFPGCGMSLLDIFQAPTIERQAEGIVKQMGASPQASSLASPPSSGRCSPSRASSTTDATSVDGDSPADADDGNKFAIVGMAGYFPGAADVDEFWAALLERRDAITTHSNPAPPADLADDEVFVPRYGSLPADLPAFDPHDWDMTPEEAATTDPQKLHLLTIASRALADAGIALNKRKGGGSNPIGVFVGAAPNTHREAATTPVPSDRFQARHRALLDPPASTFAAHRLGLAGPAATLNTACSSALVALRAALDALSSSSSSSSSNLSHHTAVDEAAGVDVALVAATTIAFPQAGGYVTARAGGQVFSSSGACRPLDARADGCVPADAVACVVVKRLAAARRDGDRVYAVVEGGAVRTDGAAADKVGFAVPSSEGQARAVGAAWRDAGVVGRGRGRVPRYVEMHGSGTSVGDAVEVRGLGMALGEARRGGEGEGVGGNGKEEEEGAAAGVTWVGSNKGAFGNAEAAGGMVSLVKMALAVSRGVVPPLRELGAPNPLCDFEGARLRPLLSCMKLAAEDRVGVTSLGYGGANAHFVLASPEAYGVLGRAV